jgi:flagellar hook-basal body complex protein FliE
MDPVRFPSAGPPPELRGPSGSPKSGPSFADALGDALDSMQSVQSASDESARRFALGQETDLHTVLLEVEKADLSFRTMMEVRNKLIDAYREILRMQI